MSTQTNIEHTHTGHMHTHKEHMHTHTHTHTHRKRQCRGLLRDLARRHDAEGKEKLLTLALTGFSRMKGERLRERSGRRRGRSRAMADRRGEGSGTHHHGSRATPVKTLS